MVALGTLSRADAARFNRTIEEPGGRLLASRMAPMSGNTPVSLGSLAEVEAFLVVLTPEEVMSLSTSQRIHYVDPRSLCSWVRDTVGDVDLAIALEEVVATGRVYGQLVPEMKQLIAARLAQYEASLSDEQEES